MVSSGVCVHVCVSVCVDSRCLYNDPSLVKSIKNENVKTFIRVLSEEETLHLTAYLFRFSYLLCL